MAKSQITKKQKIQIILYVMKPFYFDSIFFDYFTTGRVARLQNSLGLLIKKFKKFFNQDETIGLNTRSVFNHTPLEAALSKEGYPIKTLFKTRRILKRVLMSFDVDRFQILLVFFIIQTNLVC